ncbi:MAG: beta-N-acetylhexosaminidase, partial [Bacteroidota bacterium]
MRFLFLLCLLVFLGCSEEKKWIIGETAILPKPVEQTTGEGHFELHTGISIAVENEAQLQMVTRFFKAFEKVTAWMPNVEISADADIVFNTQDDLASEAYVLEVKTDKIEIQAASEAGFFYALQSLGQLLPIEFYGEEGLSDKRWGIPLIRIEDEPTFAWRGFMLDVSRHFFTVDQVKEVLDFVATQKLNRFHWHLTDDQGWRLEIKSYPKLTEVGAWRVDHNNTDENLSDWWGRPVQKEGEQATYGGFYTQEEVKDIIAYAKERYIEIIPEIDMPGHAQAAVASYPEIGCVNAAKYVATGGVYKNNTLNPGKDETYVFAEKVLNEVMDLFPYDYVHIGGDECNKSQWKVDADAQRKMKEEGLKNEEELQSYFIERLEKIINKGDKIMIGWDEILEGGLAPNATVMSWRGEEGGFQSVKMNHEVIMTPNKYCYIDLKQGHDDLEPNLGYSQLLLSKAYSY